MPENTGDGGKSRDTTTHAPKSDAKPVTRRKVVLDIGKGLIGLAGMKSGFDVIASATQDRENARKATQADSTPQGADNHVVPKPEKNVDLQSASNPVTADRDDAYYQSLTPEQQNLVNVTADHLLHHYGQTMDKHFYPSEGYKLDFWKEVTEMGIRLNPDNPNLGNQLAAVMAFETAGTFSPVIENASGSGAKGLIQFMPKTAENLETTLDELTKLSPIKQLKYVEDYFRSMQEHFDAKLVNVGDVYMAVFCPTAIGKGADHILYTPGTEDSNDNLVIDRVGGNNDGIIRRGEAERAVIELATKKYHENLAFLTS
jgi:hypothetical protein